MDQPDPNIYKYTADVVADMVGKDELKGSLSPSRIRQLCSGKDPIDHAMIYGRLLISDKGIEQVKARRKTVGRPPSVERNGNGRTRR